LNKRATPQESKVRVFSSALAVGAVFSAANVATVAEVPNASSAGIRSRRWITVLAAVLFLAASGGCQILDSRDTEALPSPAVEPASESEQSVKANFSTVIEYLESGRGEDARSLLLMLKQETPDSSVLAGLLRQIDQPAEQLLPGPYREVEVGAGESLSLIAARELGDPLMFYALARLNQIEIPARIPVGTVLRVPRTINSDNASGQAQSRVAAEPSEISIHEIESVAEYLARSGQGAQARAMLIDALAESNGVQSTRQLLTRLTLDRAAELRGEAAQGQAIGIIDETLSVIGASGQRTILTNARDSIRAEVLGENAMRLREQGELVEAYETAVQAAGLEPTAAKWTSLVGDLRARLIDTLHNEALLAWRDRNVDLAIRNWESLVAVVPDFEPAQVYLERARLLRERLDEP